MATYKKRKQLKQFVSMRIKNLIIAFFSIVIAEKINAQQIFRVSQFMQHNFLYNPAAAGSNTTPSIGFIHRKMWSDIDGGPTTSIVFGDIYFSKWKTGVGLVVYNDITGPTSRTGGEISLSYAIPFTDKKRLQFGLGGQVLQEKIDMQAIEKYIPGDPLLQGPSSCTTGDASAGIYYTSSTLNMGVSVKQLVQSKLKFIESTVTESAKLYRHYFISGSYNWRTDEDNVITPNFSIKFVENAPVDLEAGARIEHKDFIWVGISAHHQQNFILYTGVKINHKLSIGYAYDQYSTPSSIFESGGAAHEISLSYSFIN